MGFKRAVENTPGLEQAYRAGLQALQRTDRSCVSCRASRMISGSVNLDSALALSLPDDPRWDYGVGLRAPGNSEKAVWIEVHPASSHHVDEVLGKLAWLKTWLRTDAPRLNAFPREFAWIASGNIALQASSPQRRKIAAQGLRFAGRHLPLA